MKFSFDTGVPHANACECSISESDGVATVAFAADPHGGPESLWFCFRLKCNDGESTSSQQIQLVLKHGYNMLGGHDPQYMRPVVRHDDGDWQRLGGGTIDVLPDGRWNVGWQIDAPASVVDVAYCYPYGQAELQKLVEETGGYWQCDSIGVSQAGRPLHRLSNSYGKGESTRPGLYLVARQHSGETPGSWVLDGFLREVARHGDAAPLLWAVPLSNIDGVEGGDYGKDNFPYDLNRAWGQPPMRHEVLAMQSDVDRWSHRCRPVLALDFHAPGACEFEGIYCFALDAETYPQQHQAVTEWGQLLQEALQELANSHFCRVASYASRWNTPNTAQFFAQQYGLASITLEIPYALAGEVLFTRERYQQAGARIAAMLVSATVQ